MILDSSFFRKGKIYQIANHLLDFYGITLI